MKIFKFELRCAKFYVELEIYCGYAIMYLLQLCSFMDTEPVSSILEKLLSSLSLQQLKVRAKSTVVACIVCYSNDVNCTQLIRTVHASVISEETGRQTAGPSHNDKKLEFRKNTTSSQRAHTQSTTEYMCTKLILIMWYKNMNIAQIQSFTHSQN